MNRPLSLKQTRSFFEILASANPTAALRRVAFRCAAAALFVAGVAAAQVITIDSHGNASTDGKGSAVDRRYQQITPTNVELTKSELDAKTRLELIRLMQAEQGFAMRPFPRGHKGLMLAANGKLEPAGEKYLDQVVKEGMSAKPGDRLVVTEIKFERSKMIFELNGGPDPRHRFLRHVQIGGGMGGGTSPVVQDGGEPVGSRLTLTFQDHVPELTGAQVKQLLSPLISFDVKTPIQAFTDTLPKPLKDAILTHHVMVGMSTEMVLYAKGQPESKSREMEGQMPFEEWIYGQPPKNVEFIRINGNRVIRVEVAKMGEKPVIFTKDEVEGLMRTDGTPLTPPGPGPRTVQMGDVVRDPDTQAAAGPPSLRNPGEKLPTDDKRIGVMKPVQFPKQKTEPPQPGANPEDAQPPDATPAQPAKPAVSAQPSSQPNQPDDSAPPK